MRVCIISTGRPKAVSAMTELVGHAHWYVADGDAAPYADAGASNVHVTGGLIESRNAALEDAFAADELCVQVSDDLVSIRRVNDEGKVVGRTFSQLVNEATRHLTANCRLVGVAPTANAFYASTKVKRAHFIVGDFFVAAPSPIRFDPTLRLKEDYDYTAAHMAMFGEVARLDWWLLNFRHRTNPGGAVSYRSAELEQASIARLKAKWPGVIRDNPRRPNEVLLRY